jgi:CheY-like chemotaxis protein
LHIHPDPELARIKSARAEYVVVEPEPILLRLLHRYLTKDTVSAAPSVQAALAMSRTQVTRAIVVRTTHELEARRLLATAVQTPYDAPLIVCSMPGLPDLYNKELGLAGYLLKPITRQQLLATLAGFPNVKTVLLVDDDADFRQLFVRMVQTAAKPYLVWQAMNAAEALKMIEQRRPDAIFLDVFLGDMDGPGLLQQIRCLPECQKTLIFFITAKDAAGSPLVASSLDITHRGGLSADELLRCIQAIGEAFRGATPPVNRTLYKQPDPELPTVAPG